MRAYRRASARSLLYRVCVCKIAPFFAKGAFFTKTPKMSKKCPC